MTPPNPTPPTFSHRIACALVRYRYAGLAFVVGVTLLSLYFAPRVIFDHDYPQWFLSKDTQVENYRWFKSTFPSDEFVLIAFSTTKNPLSKRNLQIQKRLSDGLKTMTIRRRAPIWSAIADGIELAISGEAPPPLRPIYRVVSFTTVQHAVNRWSRDPDAAGDPVRRFWIDEPDESEHWSQVVRLGRFLVHQPRTDRESRHLLKRALANKRFRNTLINKSGDFVAVIGILRNDINPFWYKQQLSNKVFALVDRVNSDHKTDLVASGMFIFGVEFEQLNQKDGETLLPIMLGVVMLILLLIFRSFSGVILPMLVMLVAIVWIKGTTGLLGLNDNLLSGMLPPLLVAVGIADTIHYISVYRASLTTMGKSDAVIAALSKVLTPCFFTSLTTAVGFASLMTSNLGPLAQMGGLAALGVLFAFVLSTLSLPVVLDLLRKPKKSKSGADHGGLTPFFRMMDRIAATTRDRPGMIGILFALIVVASAVGISQVKLETNDIEMMKPSNSKRQALNEISSRLSGVTPLVYIFDTQRPNGVKDPKFLKKLDRFQLFLESDVPAVRNANSLLDYLKEFRGVYMGGELAEYRVPATRREVGQLLTQLEGDSTGLADYVDFNYRYARLSANVGVLGSKAYVALIARLDGKLAELGLWRRKLALGAVVPPGIGAKPAPTDYTVTGLISLFVTVENYLLDSLVSSFSLALIVICFLMMIQLRSIKLGLLSMIPNVLPIAIGLGVMGYLKINLDIGTAMIASVAIGISVDDTIHFMERHSRKVRAGKDYSVATSETLREAGLPIFITSVILFLGFLTLTAGQFIPTINFGLLAAVTIIGALVADLLILPVVLAALKPY